MSNMIEITDGGWLQTILFPYYKVGNMWNEYYVQTRSIDKPVGEKYPEGGIFLFLSHDAFISIIHLLFIKAWCFG